MSASPGGQFSVGDNRHNTLSLLAPHAPYLKSGNIRDVKQAIDRLHAARIAVILNVVYNYTCEGNEMGTTLSFRGFDHTGYCLLDDKPRHCYDTTDCGNTVNVADPMVLDSLCYWVADMHIDGFRFNLASTLWQESTGFEREELFFAAVQQCLFLSGLKLIAKPWDIGNGSYQVSDLPWTFCKWKDKARDGLHAFWRRDPGSLPNVAERLSGSPMQFNHSHRPATSSVNFLDVHDGFTLRDSYNDNDNDKPVDANYKDEREGNNHNISHNLGAEEQGNAPTILGVWMRPAKGMLATLFMSQGVPMLLARDKFGQSQQGEVCETGWQSVQVLTRGLA